MYMLRIRNHTHAKSPFSVVFSKQFSLMEEFGSEASVNHKKTNTFTYLLT